MKHLESLQVFQVSQIKLGDETRSGWECVDLLTSGAARFKRGDSQRDAYEVDVDVFGGMVLLRQVWGPEK